jgi:hypothetical protein
MLLVVVCILIIQHMVFGSFLAGYLYDVTAMCNIIQPCFWIWAVRYCVVIPINIITKPIFIGIWGAIGVFYVFLIWLGGFYSADQ